MTWFMVSESFAQYTKHRIKISEKILWSWWGLGVPYSTRVGFLSETRDKAVLHFSKVHFTTDGTCVILGFLTISPVATGVLRKNRTFQERILSNFRRYKKTEILARLF